MALYKVFDILTGNTYLIGEHESKEKAKAYCTEQGIITIPKMICKLTEEEYKRALEHRKES